MRDLIFVGFLLALIGMGMRRPFLFVLAYAYVDIVSPQHLSYYLLNSVPISMIVASLAIGGWLVADSKNGMRVAPRQFLMLILLAAWRLLFRPDLDDEKAGVPDASAKTPSFFRRMGKGRPGA